MGLKNYQEQLNVIKQANKQVEYLKNYAKGMFAQMVSLDSIWDENADSLSILNAMGDCIYEASDIYEDYNLFSINALRWLNNMDNLEELATSWITGRSDRIRPIRSNYDGSSVGGKRSHICIYSKDVVDTIVKDVSSYTEQLSSIHAKTSGINNQIDKLIINKFAPQYSLVNINKRINRLCNHNSQVAVALKSMIEGYESTEAELMKYIEGMTLNANSSGEVSSQIDRGAGSGDSSNTNEGDVSPITDVKIDSESSNQDNTTNIVDDPGLDDGSIYLKQPTGSGQCTLYSNLMMMRRYAKIHGDPNWADINADTYKDKLWTSNGMVFGYNFTVNGNETDVICSAYQGYPASLNQAIQDMHTTEEKTEYLKSLLTIHPEGVVIYDWSSSKNNGRPHAVLLTEYKDGKFYVADPAYGDVRDMDSSYVSVDGIDQIWAIS